MWGTGHKESPRKKRDCVTGWVEGISVNKWIWEPCILHPLLGVHNAPESFKGSEKACSKEIQLFNLEFLTNYGTPLSSDQSMELVFWKVFLVLHCLAIAPLSKSSLESSALILRTLPLFGQSCPVFWNKIQLESISPLSLLKEVGDVICLPTWCLIDLTSPEWMTQHDSGTWHFHIKEPQAE